MTPADWDVIIKGVVTLLSGVVIPWAILAYQARTGKQVTDQQRAAVDKALTTGAGIVQTMIDKGQLPVKDVTPENHLIMIEARSALARVPDSAKAQGTTPAAAAAILAGKLDTSEKRNAA